MVYMMSGKQIVEGNMEATKEQVIAAGMDMANRGHIALKKNHMKVIEWIKTLKNVPSTSSADATYKACCREYVEVVLKGNPNGTGAYNLDTL